MRTLSNQITGFDSWDSELTITTMIIRTAHPDEWSKLQILNDEVFGDNIKYAPDLKRDWAFSDAGRSYFQELVKDPEQCCFVAEEEGKLVGYIAGAEKEFSYCKSRYFEIENMGVTASHRNRGVGSRLFSAIKDWAKEKGYGFLYVNSFWKNQGAIAFYKQNGLSEIDVSLEMKL